MVNTIDRKTAPISNALEKITIAHAQLHTLDNGINVGIISSGTQDIIKVEFIFNAGVWHQTISLQATCCNAMLDEGTKSKKASEIADAVDYYGAFIEMEANQDWATVTLYSLTKHLEKVLPVLEDVLKNSVFPEEELDILLQNKQQSFFVDEQKVAHVARTRFNAIIFGKESPYTYKLKQDDFNLLKRNHLIDFYNTHYKSNNCKILLSGKVNDAAINLINKYFGGKDWGGNSKLPIQTTGVSKPDLQKKHLIERTDALQSAIRIGRVLFNKLHPDYHAMKILNTVLGGYFGSRLMANIREDKGYTYGIGSRIISLKNEGYFFISTEVGVDVCKAAIKEIYTEVNQLQNNLIPQSELELVKNYMLGDFVRSIDGPFALADKFKKIM
ncbi:MAG: insulinase family protein, partial [Bacteroidia bacterium]|nr:insulinase family protein [Bacteroidia bacterium]